MESPPPQPAPGRGPPASFAFYPEDDVPALLSDYLRRRIAREPLPADTAVFFHEADVYAADPAALVADYLPAPGRKGESERFFFFCEVRPKNTHGARKSRTVGDNLGTWKVDSTKDVVDGDGRLVGYHKKLYYKPNYGDKRRVWLMREFGVDQEDQEDGKVRLVLCKIYQSPRSASNSSSSGSSSKRFATAEPPDHPAARRRLVLDPPAPSPTPPAASPAKNEHAKNSAIESSDKFFLLVGAEREEEWDAKNAAMESFDKFLVHIEQQPDAEESQCEALTLDHGLAMAGQDQTLPPPSCNDTALLRPCSSAAATSGSWTAESIMEPADEEFWRSLGIF